MPKEKLQFAALPPRMAADKRLNRSHFRLMMAIAYHDRFGLYKETSGCWAAQKKIADETGLHYTNIARLRKDLIEWAYLIAKPHPMGKLKETYFVLYDVGEPTNQPQTEVGTPTKENSENVGEEESQVFETNDETPVEDINRPKKVNISKDDGNSKSGDNELGIAINIGKKRPTGSIQMFPTEDFKKNVFPQIGGRLHNLAQISYEDAFAYFVDYPETYDLLEEAEQSGALTDEDLIKNYLKDIANPPLDRKAE